jgi:hypothetical protein
MARRNARSFLAATAVIGTGALAVFFGCSSFEPNDDAPNGDAAVTETSTTDVADGSPGDGGSSDATAQPFCQRYPTATFCADFDDGMLTAPPWSDFEPVDASLAQIPTVDSALSVSGKFSLLAKIGPLLDGTHSESFASRKSAAAPQTRAHFEFQLYLQTIDPLRSAYLALIAFGGGGYATRHKVWLYLDDGAAVLAQQPATPDGGSDPPVQKEPFSKDLDVGKWHHVALDVDFGKSLLSASVDGTPAAQLNVSQGAVPGPVRINVGIDYVDGPQMGIAVRYDDVLLTLD